MADNKIFISYRRDDAVGYAGRIFDRLNARFPGQVFMDTAVIPIGVHLLQAIQDIMGSCHAVIAVIGRHWATITDGQGNRRLDRSDDLVRLEIANALQQDVIVIPVLVRGASMPSAYELPPDLAPLATRNALEVTDTDFDHDIARLISALEYSFPESRPSFPQPPPTAAHGVLEEKFPEEPQEFVHEPELVFICYSRKDEEFSLKLAASLKQRGVNVWIDQWNIPASADWDLSIDEALSKCDRFLIVLSPSATTSRHVRSELQVALDENKCIVPVLHQQCKIPRSLRLTQHLDFTSASPDDETRIEELVNALNVPK